jgi:hypothetical protein
MLSQIISPHLILVFTIIILSVLIPSVLPLYNAHSQSVSNNPVRNAEFKEYHDPFSNIKINYPSSWQKSDMGDSGIILLVSPIKTVGVIVQNTLTLNASIDEITMDTISFVRDNFLNATIIDTVTSTSADNATIQSITFTFVGDKDLEKALLLSKIFEDRTYTFLYYADNDLFIQFLPLASVMLDSFQIPYMDKAFSSIHLTSSGNIYSEDFATYRNNNLGIEIKYPPYTLDKIENSRGITFTSEVSKIGIIVANIPLKSPSLDDFRSQQILYLNQTLKNFEITDSDVSRLMGSPTEMLLFNYDNRTQPYAGMQLITVSGDNGYIFTYFAPSIRVFHEFMDTAQEMLDSLQLF